MCFFYTIHSQNPQGLHIVRKAWKCYESFLNFIILCKSHFMTTGNTNEEQQNVIADFANELNSAGMEGYERAVKKARNALFWAGGLIFLGEMIAMYSQGLGFQPIIFVIGLVEAGIFVALALWTKKKPYTAVVCGLIAFIGIILLSMIGSGMEQGSAGVLKALFSGIIVKVIILVNLILPLKDAKALQEARKQQF